MGKQNSGRSRFFCSGKNPGVNDFFAPTKGKRIILNTNDNKYDLECRISCLCQFTSLNNFKKVENWIKNVFSPAGERFFTPVIRPEQSFCSESVRWLSWTSRYQSSRFFCKKWAMNRSTKKLKKSIRKNFVQNRKKFNRISIELILTFDFRSHY